MKCMRLSAGGSQFVRCREVVRSSEYPLLEVPLYLRICSVLIYGVYNINRLFQFYNSYLEPPDNYIIIIYLLFICYVIIIIS